MSKKHSNCKTFSLCKSYPQKIFWWSRTSTWRHF